MDKQDTFTICKQVGLRKVKDRSIANHAMAVFAKAGHELIVHYSPYAERIWAMEIHTKGGSCICITSLEQVKHYFQNIN